MAEVTLNINANFQQVFDRLDRLEKSMVGLSSATDNYNQKSSSGFQKTAQSADQLNKEIKEQQKIIKEMSREAEKLAKTQSKHTAEQAQAYKRLQGDLKVANQELKQMQSTQQQLQATTSKGSAMFQKLGASIVAAFTVGAIINFGRRAIAEWDAQEKAVQKLKIAIGGNEDATRRLVKQSTELAKTTLFNDDDIINAQAMIGLLSKDEGVIKRLMPLVADLATAKGMDLASAADLVSKSIGSSTNALGRYGIEITGAVGSTERLDSAVLALNKTVGGQAEGAAKVGASSIQQLNKAWGEFLEAVGSAQG